MGGLQKFNDITSKVTIKEFKRILQCPIHEPELNSRGSLSLYKLLPPTRKTVERICAYLQTECNPWKQCDEEINLLKSKEDFDKAHYVSSPYQVKLYRVIDNKLYFDWPWGNYQDDLPDQSMTSSILSVISRVSDIGESVFLMVLLLIILTSLASNNNYYYNHTNTNNTSTNTNTDTKGEEISFLQYNIPFPAFSAAPKGTSSEMPWYHSYCCCCYYHYYCYCCCCCCYNSNYYYYSCY